VNLPYARIPRPCRAHAILLLIGAVLAPTLGWAQQSLEDQALEQQGLTQAQAGCSGTVGAGLALVPKYPGVYTPRAGINRMGLHAGLTQRVTQHFLVRISARLSDLTGEAAQSPIVERRTLFAVGAGIAYHF